MKFLRAGTETRLVGKALLGIEDGVAQRIECSGGAIWITQSNQPRDIVLEPGQSITLPRPASVLIGAINGPALVRATALRVLAAA